ncbi:MAG: DUF1501 domain-containing protein [Roseibacillus sp.]
MTEHERHLQALTRRHFLSRCGIGLGGAALGTMMGDLAQAEGAPNPLAPRKGRLPAKAKNIIYLHMAGSPTQLELFDYKPELKKHDGQVCPKEFLEGKRFAFIQPGKNPVMLGPLFEFKQHGEAGTWMSELLPNLSTVADELCVIRSMFTTQFNHSPAQLLLHTGDPRFGAPSMGSWVTYGLGSENENLPGFVVLASGGRTPSAGKSVWGSGYLPSVYQGTQCRNTGDPVLYLANPEGLDRATRRRQLDALRELNEIQHRAIGDPETISRIAQYELTYRMQTEAAVVMDISRESKHILEMYGAKPGVKSTADMKSVGDKPLATADDPSFANNCLLARRLVESGVRFVQLYDWGWDHHGSSQPEDMKTHLPVKTRQIDRPIAALIRDLKQRGLLEETLVVWGGEFGRTPMRENRGGRYGKYIGRDHHPFAFTMWMAGGGIKGGLNFGATDEIGYYPTENPMSVRDLQATILHQLGLDPFRFGVMRSGLNSRLIGPTDEGKVRKEILG